MLIRRILISKSLLILSLIMQPHAITRYPAKDFDPIDFYTSNLPLIVEFPQIIEITELNIKLFDDLIN